VVRSNHNKTEIRLEKLFHGGDIISRLDVTVWKTKSPCCHAEKVADTIVADLIFNRAMEKTNSLCPLAVAEEKIDP
jgi:hypothetical protein